MCEWNRESFVTHTYWAITKLNNNVSVFSALQKIEVNKTSKLLDNRDEYKNWEQQIERHFCDDPHRSFVLCRSFKIVRSFTNDSCAQQINLFVHNLQNARSARAHFPRVPPRSPRLHYTCYDCILSQTAFCAVNFLFVCVLIGALTQPNVRFIRPICVPPSIRNPTTVNNEEVRVQLVRCTVAASNKMSENNANDVADAWGSNG